MHQGSQGEHSALRGDHYKAEDKDQTMPNVRASAGLQESCSLLITEEGSLRAAREVALYKLESGARENDPGGQKAPRQVKYQRDKQPQNIQRACKGPSEMLMRAKCSSSRCA